MTFAFCNFYAGYWMTATTHATFDETLLGLFLAMTMSIFAFSGIFFLDGLDDSVGGVDHTGSPQLHRIIVQIVMSFAILVGFSWERCFDQAVGVLASCTPSPALAKLGLAIFCSMLLIPAWRSH